jgi:hypothetical protein
MKMRAALFVVFSFAASFDVLPSTVSTFVSAPME